MTNLVNQKQASAGHSIVAGDQTNNQTNNVRIFNNTAVITNIAAPKPIIDGLLAELKKEIEGNQNTSQMIEMLNNFYVKKASDGIQGLEAKLKAANREHEIEDALEKKELFRKMLERWALYESAQKIFAHLLSRAEFEFNSTIKPQLSSLDEVALNRLIGESIVNPTVQDCGYGTLMMPHGVAMGMFYWLAEQCFVRWHK